MNMIKYLENPLLDTVALTKIIKNRFYICIKKSNQVTKIIHTNHEVLLKCMKHTIDLNKITRLYKIKKIIESNNKDKKYKYFNQH